MKHLILHHPFTALCLIGLVVYQAINFSTSHFYQPLRERLNKTDGPVFRVVDQALVKYGSVDESAGLLGRAGFAVRYLFHQANTGIIYGPRDPWQRFFWRDDLPFESLESAGDMVWRLADFMQTQVDYFETRGIPTVVVPPPTQASINPQFFSGITPELFRPDERSTQDPIAVYRRLVEARPRQVIDLQKIYRRYLQDSPQAELFGPFNSHWSSLGIAVAARGVIENLSQRGYPLQLSAVSFSHRDTPHYEHDFLLNLMLPEYLLRRAPQFQWPEPLYRLTSASSGGVIQRVVVAGTSYSTRHKGSPFSLGRVVADALGASLVDYSFDGAWSSGSLKKMQKEEFTFQPGDLFLWELPLKSAQNLRFNPPGLQRIKVQASTPPA